MRFPILIFGIEHDALSVVRESYGEDTIIATWLAITEKRVLDSYIIDSNGNTFKITNMVCVEHVPWWKKNIIFNPFLKYKVLSENIPLELTEAQYILIRILKKFKEIGLREFLDFNKVYAEIHAAHTMVDLLSIMLKVYSRFPDYYPDFDDESESN